LAYKAGLREERLPLIETVLEKEVDQILAQCMAYKTSHADNIELSLEATTCLFSPVLQCGPKRR
jgi:hypothetical protein